MRLQTLLKDLFVEELLGDPDTEITQVTYDSRKAVPGCLFAAVRGVREDGSRFIAAAIERGARAVLYEEYAGERPDGVTFAKVPDARLAMAMAAAAFYGYPARRLDLIGITGTNGKTTTSYLIRSVLESAGRDTGLIGTISYEYGGKVLNAPNTTPESVDLQCLLGEMADAGAEYAVIEVSSHAVALKRVAGCEFKVRVFTNFTQDHLDFHGSMDEYYAAKRSFFTEGPGMSVINLDDPKGWDLASSAPDGVLTYGLKVPADVTAKDIRLSPDGVSFTLVTPGGEAAVKSPLVGRHNVYNILAAAGACLSAGIGPSEIAAGVAAMKEVPGRLEKVDEGQDFTVLVDYAHTEDALAHVLSTAREFTPGRVVTVFGCGGDRDRSKRPKMGYAASLLSDIVVLTSDNPRTEDPAEILRQVEAGVYEEGSKKKGETYFVIPDRGEAIEFAVGMAGAGDTLLIAGKGHEDYQIVGAGKYHFDDRQAARQAILSRVSGGRK
jgi:UDP-N-acetylmuramoyl-L-alanyl-D-glutamate--2,6-diaminopimelate ligase